MLLETIRSNSLGIGRGKNQEQSRTLLKADFISFTAVLTIILLAWLVRKAVMHVRALHSLMITVLTGSTSAAACLLAGAMRHWDGQFPSRAIQVEPALGNVLLLMNWIVFAHQAELLVGKEGTGTDESHQIDWRGMLHLLDLLPVIATAVLAGCTLVFPRAYTPLPIGLASIAVNLACDAFVVFPGRFVTIWRGVVTRIGLGTQAASGKASTIAHQPITIGMALMSMTLPMLLTTLVRQQWCVQLEQVWMTALLPVRILGLAVCFFSIAIAAEHHKQELQRVMTVAAQERAEVQQAASDHRAAFLRYGECQCAFATVKRVVLNGFKAV